MKMNNSELSDMKVQVFGGDTAIVTGKWNGSGTFNGQPFSGPESFKDTLVKENGKWKFVATHSSKIQGGGQSAQQ